MNEIKGIEIMDNILDYVVFFIVSAVICYVASRGINKKKNKKDKPNE